MEANAQRSHELEMARLAAPKRSVPIMTTAEAWNPGVASRKENNALPTTQQLNMPGYFTGQVKSAADGTRYREYRRPDGSTYWVTP